MRKSALLTIAGVLLASGCGGDEERRAADSPGTATVRPGETGTAPSTTAETEAPPSTTQGGAPSKPAPRKAKSGRGGTKRSKSKPTRGQTPSQAPVLKPAPGSSGGDAEEAERKAQEGDAPILGGGAPDR
jgi:hypothetical protein